MKSNQISAYHLAMDILQELMIISLHSLLGSFNFQIQLWVYEAFKNKVQKHVLKNDDSSIMHHNTWLESQLYRNVC